MARIPFGVPHLDSVVGGGAPQGTVVLLAGEPGAGAREFMHTTAVMNGLARADPDLFELYYGDLAGSTTLDPAIHYLAFTADAESIRSEMVQTIDGRVVDAAVEEIRFRDFSPEYFQLSPVPREWYADGGSTLQDVGDRHSREDVLSALGTYLSRHAAGNIVLIDSLTDLVAAITDEMSWTDIAMVMRGLGKASHRWGGLVLALVSRATLASTELGHLVDAADGTLHFEWESGGSRRARTMIVQEFRGVLARLESESIVRFETEITESGFDVSDVRKIR